MWVISLVIWGFLVVWWIVVIVLCSVIGCLFLVSIVRGLKFVVFGGIDCRLNLSM